MSWFHIIHGKCFTFNGEIENLRAKPWFEDLAQRAETLGFVLKQRANDDEQTQAVFIGVDIYPDQYIFQGKTICCPIEKTQQVPTELTDDLRTWLQSHGVENLKETDGVIVCQFD